MQEQWEVESHAVSQVARFRLSLGAMLVQTIDSCSTFACQPDPTYDGASSSGALPHCGPRAAAAVHTHGRTEMLMAQAAFAQVGVLRRCPLSHHRSATAAPSCCRIVHRSLLRNSEHGAMGVQACSAAAAATPAAAAAATTATALTYTSFEGNSFSLKFEQTGEAGSGAGGALTQSARRGSRPSPPPQYLSPTAASLLPACLPACLPPQASTCSSTPGSSTR